MRTMYVILRRKEEEWNKDTDHPMAPLAYGFSNRLRQEPISRVNRDGVAINATRECVGLRESAASHSSYCDGRELKRVIGA